MDSWHRLKRIVVLAVIWSVPWLARGALVTNLVDTLDTTNHFFAGNTLTVTANGNSTVSLTHNAAGDEVAQWGINGADQPIVYEPGRSQLQVQSTAGIASGQWGFDILWFDSTATYIGQSTFQAPTAATGLFSYDINGAPGPTVSWSPQFRVFNSGGAQGAGGYGFTFTEIDALQVPEPSVLGLTLLGLTVWHWARRSRQKP